jgi:hypothetical protein
LCFLIGMTLTADSLPDDVAILKAMVTAGHAARLAAEVKAQHFKMRHYRRLKSLDHAGELRVEGPGCQARPPTGAAPI